LVSRGAAGRSLAILLEYPGQHELSSSVQVNSTGSRRSKAENTVCVGLLGAGNYVKSTLLPAMKTVAGTEMVGICAASGLSAAQSATRGGFSFATTDAQDIIANSKVNTIVIATRHHLHAQQVIAALGAGKHIFCEKPLCLHEGELQEIIFAYEAASEISRPVFMVGFNRRFAPLTVELKQFVAEVREPLLMSYRVNAGSLASSHWANDPAQGGGRIVGEVCHFVDLMTFLCGSQAVQVFATATPNAYGCSPDNANLHITFANGSTGVITYATNGHKLFPKERLEVFAQGRVAVLDDFCELELVSGANRRKRRSLFRVDKGHNAEWRAMVQSVLNGGPAPIPCSEIVATTRATIRMLDSLRSGRPEPVQLELRNASPPGSTAVQPPTVRNGSWSGDSRGDGLSERRFGR
ncbi:MAG TPA: Gfo/Idh/MocA family oxidoreductase, partial [Terriglobales bacterium]|nr:Gfo/Idh/MocA family oxidoreductase [Terriglobales bacterium]